MAILISFFMLIGREFKKYSHKYFTFFNMFPLIIYENILKTDLTKNLLSQDKIYDTNSTKAIAVVFIRLHSHTFIVCVCSKDSSSLLSPMAWLFSLVASHWLYVFVF